MSVCNFFVSLCFAIDFKPLLTYPLSCGVIVLSWLVRYLAQLLVHVQHSITQMTCKSLRLACIDKYMG